MTRSISLDTLWESATPSKLVFSSDKLAHLPAAAKRYLEHTIAPHLGVILASARVVAHIPEGIVTNAEFKSQKMPRTERFLLLVAFIISAWLGATLGYLGWRGQADLPKLIVLAFTTGTLIVAIAEEILPEAHQTQDTNGSTWTFMGFALSILFSSYLE
jgi:zinc transporter, ZIP family